MAVAASTKQPTSENYISSIDLINQRNVDTTLYERFPGQGIMKLWDMMGRKKPTTNPKIEWVETDRVFQSIVTTGSVSAPGAGANLVLTLNAASHRDSGVNSYPRINALVQLPNRKVGQVILKDTTTPGAHTITIKPIKSTDDLGAVTNGTYIMFFSNAWSEGSGQGTGLTPVPLNFSATLQIIKETYGVTSTQGLTRSWFEVEGPDGKKGYYWSYKGEKDTFTRFQAEVGLALLIGEQADANFTGPDGQVTRTTKGLLPWVREGGNNYTSAGFVLNTFDQIFKALNKQKGAKENIMALGYDLTTTIDNLLTVQMKNDVSNYEFFQSSSDKNKLGDSKARAAQFGFDSFKKQGYTMHFFVADEFNEENQLGTTGYNYANTGVIIPTDKRSVVTDGKIDDEYSLSLMYLAGDGYSREYEHWTEGAGTMSPNKQGGLDLVNMHYRCEKGFRGISGNRFAIVE